MIVECNHKPKKLTYFITYSMAFLGGFALHSRMSTDSQYRIERRDSGRPYLIDKGTKDEWYLDGHLLNKLPFEHPQAKDNSTLEDRAR